MFLECTLVASYGRSVLSRFFEEWKYHHLPALEYIDAEPDQAEYIGYMGFRYFRYYFTSDIDS